MTAVIHDRWIRCGWTDCADEVTDWIEKVTVYPEPGPARQVARNETVTGALGLCNLHARPFAMEPA